MATQNRNRTERNDHDSETLRRVEFCPEGTIALTVAQLDEIKAAEADYIVGLAISIGALMAGVIIGYDRVAPEWRPAFVMFGLVVFSLAFNAGYLYRVYREWRKA